MAAPDNLSRLRGQAPDEISAVLESARSAVDQEFHLSQRLDTKMQYQFAVTAGWFGVAQTFAAVVLNRADVPPFWIGLVLVLGGLSIASVAWAIRETFAVWKLRPDKGIDPEKLKVWADRVHARDPVVPGEIAKEYAVLLDERRSRNEQRASAIKTSYKWCGYSVAITTAELIVALVSRLLFSG